jgi:hypothetical protein
MARKFRRSIFCYFSIAYMESFADRPARNAGRAAAAKLDEGRDDRSTSQNIRSGRTIAADKHCCYAH